MNINNISDVAYNHNFNIDSIEQAYELHKIISQKLDKLNIKEQNKKQLQTYANDFQLECKRLINRNNINSEKDYCYSLNALIIINTKAQSILYSKEYRHNIDIELLKDDYNRVDKHIATFQSKEKLFIIFIIILTIILVSLVFFMSYLLKELTLLNALLLISIPLIFYKKIGKTLKRLHIKYTLYKYNYIGHKKMKKLFHLITPFFNHLF